MNNNDIRKAMDEFYNFRYVGNLREHQKSGEFIELGRKLEKGFDLMSKNTNNFNDISIKKILEIINKNSEHIEEFVILFRMLTAVSKMNFETYFVSELCIEGIWKPQIKKKKDGTPFEREVMMGKEKMDMPDFEKIVDLAKEEKKILKSMMSFFNNYDIVKKLKNLKGKKKESVIELSNTLLIYSEKGAAAAKSGKEAEKIIQTKLKNWGLEENIDYNKSDEKLTDILSRKIKFLTKDNKISQIEKTNALKEIKNDELSRQFDIVFPAKNSNREPKIIVQIVYYASNTGSLAKKKSTQNLNTTDYKEKVLPKHHEEINFIILVDGPGWNQMQAEFQKMIKEDDEEFVQINTVDTKLKTILNKKGFVYPIDIELAVIELLEKKETTTKKKVLEIIKNKKNMTVDINSIIEQNTQFFEGKIDEDIIQLPKNRYEIAKKFLILEKLQEITSNNKPEKYNLIIPSEINPKISDTDAFSEISKTGLNNDEIQKTIDELENEGTIIIQSV